MIRYLSLLLLFFSLVGFSFSQGSGFIEDFILPNAVGGEKFSLREYESVPTVVVIFTDMQCPYSQLYEDRIANLINDFQSEAIRFILINTNTDDSKEKMSSFVEGKDWSVPYLVDHDQRVARLFSATKSPEVFVLSRQKKSFKIVYRGGIDDNPQVPDDAHHHYLRDFLKASGAGKTFSLRTTSATGCML